MGHDGIIDAGADGAVSRISVARVAIETLTPHPHNARRGALKRIKESLRTHTQFRPVLAQRSTNFILGGNHVYRAARELGWSHLDVHFLDVNDEQAAKIMLADNRASDFASYDNEALVALLESLPDLDGTGFTDDDLVDLLNELEAPDGGEGHDSDAASSGNSTEGQPRGPRVSEGDSVILGQDRLACTDARDSFAVARVFASSAASVGLAVQIVDGALGVSLPQVAAKGISLYALAVGGRDDCAAEAPLTIASLAVTSTLTGVAMIAEAFLAVGEQLALSEQDGIAMKIAFIPDADVCQEIVAAWELQTGARAVRED
jgi:hypothetical protein